MVNSKKKNYSLTTVQYSLFYNARIRAHLGTGTALHTGVVVNTVINIVFLDRMGGANSPAGPA